MASRVLSSRLRSRLAPLLRLHSAPIHSHGSPSLPPNPILLPSSSPLARYLSTALPRRGPARARPVTKVDIGERARRLQSRRLWAYALTFSCVAGFVVIVLATFQDQLVFYVTPTDALARFAADPRKSKFRLGGLVLEGSVAHPLPASPEMEFVVTDLVTDILVKYDGSLPDLFREGHSVVVEGFVRPLTDEVRMGGAAKVTEKARSGECFFKATDVLAKHDEKYMPKEVAAALERNKKKMDAETGGGAEVDDQDVGEKRVEIRP